MLQKFALQLLNISCLHFGVSRFAQGHFYPRAGSPGQYQEFSPTNFSDGKNHQCLLDCAARQIILPLGA